MIKRIFVEKKWEFAAEAKKLLEDIKENLHLHDLKNLRIFNRYDMEGLDEKSFEKAEFTIFAEPVVDMVYDEALHLENAHIFAVEFLPGQYDQRADSATQCLKLMDGKLSPTVKFATIYAVYGEITDAEFERIKEYCINPVDSREATLEKPEKLMLDMQNPAAVQILEGFRGKSEIELESLRSSLGFAMSLQDLIFVKNYFEKEEKRDPSITELKVIDTYWSDHCRHTTFSTELEDVSFQENDFQGMLQDAYLEYLDIRKEVYGENIDTGKRPICLMDMATIGTRLLKSRGQLHDLDESEEINACSIKVKATIDGAEEDWLVMFKNETHNHPTEIEPFGGAATCLGGAIRDPLSGRVYVYQAMRVTGSGDPNARLEDTLQGKLPQRKITKGAAKGYSSYGNQIGLATGLVSEIYNEGYVAKRMEVGAVIGAAPAKNVRREGPIEGDSIILVGGKTGRDGIGGATGSSKEHTEDSILNCGAEVQKGNPPVERNLQRLFRREEVSSLIKRCNDFGAGGVSVAIGELADSLEVNLDLVPKKYEGLDGTELAISESQERMAVVVAKEDEQSFIAFAAEENLEAVAVARVTDTGRFKMFWNGTCILNLSRDFLNTNGVRQKTKVKVEDFDKIPLPFIYSVAKEMQIEAEAETESGRKSFKRLYAKLSADFITHLSELNCASQKGLVENFDSTIGAGTVLMPLGGIYQLSPEVGMAAKLPITSGYTDTTSLMTYGFDPSVSSQNPYLGGLYAVIDSATKIVAMGGDYRTIRLSFQEYFERLGTDPTSWGKPFAALLGALKSQIELGIPAIGGKDSMSGTFMDIKVPPTLISFAVAMVDANNVISTDLKSKDSFLVILAAPKDEKTQMMDFSVYKNNMICAMELIKAGKILSANTIGCGGIPISVTKMAIGNKIGVRISKELRREICYNKEAAEKIFNADYGSLILEVSKDENIKELFKDANYQIIGKTIRAPRIFGQSLEKIMELWTKPLSKVFPAKSELNETDIKEKESYLAIKTFEKRSSSKPIITYPKPRVFIPAFPGTNCEVDSKRAFENAGGSAKIQILRNMTENALEESIDEMEKNIRGSQIIMIPGGFSGGDEPDGSAKFITAVMRNPKICEAITDLIENRDGLILGICNGFQALIKLGLVPFGKIIPMDENYPTLTYNTIGRHISTLVRTKVVSVKSPWLSNARVGEIHTIPISHGEGRFIANDETMKTLIEKGQIVTQYVNFDGQPTMESPYNPNGSTYAVEGITSEDGRILGKMAHSERIGKNLYKNVLGHYELELFEAGINYFK